ncbi:hypothetical protein [Hymenobacter lucidus]|uniref:Uncharacterized protein n=1 Tax=Hymenobacter lucidus TaxID=2880930 RepID=A0ABS8ALS7_9BACT|nr:hypothetical protein [Hymenobacter lucidus]MCB2407157.1 hypothetical protein [Hymenobacter lucidus]
MKSPAGVMPVGLFCALLLLYKMNETRKKLFRELLYWGMVDIRLATAPHQGFWLNPLTLQRRRLQLQLAHEIAEWLHNLAQFSASEFENFDESRFWEDYQTFQRRYPIETHPFLFGKTIEELTRM